VRIGSESDCLLGHLDSDVVDLCRACKAVQDYGDKQRQYERCPAL